MRPVVLIAIALLLVALGRRWDLPANAELVPVVNGGGARSAAHSVHLFSTGRGLVAPSYGQRVMHRGMLIDSELYAGEPGTIGLSVVELFADGRVSELHPFNLRASTQDARDFARFVQGVEVDSVLVMACANSIGIAPKADGTEKAYGEQLGALFRRLGVTSDPTSFNSQSFAFICLRTAGGFVPLAESFSTTKSVQLSYLVPGDRALLRDVLPSRVFDRRRILSLDMDTAQSSDFTRAKTPQFERRTYEHLVALVRHEKPVQVSFELDEAAQSDEQARPKLFSAKIVMDYRNTPAILGVRFRLRIDGVPAGDRLILRDGEETRRWIAWEAHLPPGTGAIRNVTVEAELLADGPGSTKVYLAQPELTSWVE